MTTLKLRPKNQVTIPKEVLERAHISVGDRLNIEVTDGAIIIRSEQDWVTEEIARDIEAAATTPVHDFDNVEDMIRDLRG